MRACSGILAAKGIVEGAAMRIGFIGFGNMASAMADGWIAAGVDAGRMSACAGHFDALREVPRVGLAARAGGADAAGRRRGRRQTPSPADVLLAKVSAGDGVWVTSSRRC